jgi:branched-chain amino acid transport system ATP-binding protein
MSEPILRAENISRRFGGLLAVSEFNFEIRPGEVLGLIGPNGAGKSTTFNVISGYYKPTSGRITFLGHDVTGFSTVAMSRRGLVRTFQHGSLLKGMSVRDNILMGTLRSLRDNAAREKRIAETAEMVGLADMLDFTAGSLPHGHQRMLSIAIGFAARPKLLCLDEPLAGLNNTEMGAALAVMQRIRDEFGTTILLVDHNMRAIMQICERIVVLNYGRKLAEGTPAEIRNNPDVIRAYLGDGE